jgi:uncharacterized protein (TIGR03083 family)
MDATEHIGVLQREGTLLAEAAERAPLDAPLPTCPDWTVRDLVRHIGGIHRWATAIVSRTRTERFDPFQELEGHWPADYALVDWFREGHLALVDALDSAPPDLQCFTFLPAPSPRAMWARRQAHETGIHRADVEGASGPITPYDPGVAADGIEELLFGFLSRPRSKPTAEVPRTLQLRAIDSGRDWRVAIGPNGPSVTREYAPADCSVSARTSDLFLLLWNRRSLQGLDVAGASELLELWRESVHVRWS